MNTARAGAINTTALLFTIVLAMLTIVFAALAYVRADDIRITVKGDPEDPSRTPTKARDAVDNAIAVAEGQIAGLEETLERKQRALANLDYQLVRNGAYAKSRGQDVEYIWGAQNERTPWPLLRERMQESLTRLQAWSRRLSDAETLSFAVINDTASGYSDQQGEILEQAAQIETRLNADRESLLRETDRFRDEREDADEQYRRDFSIFATKKTQLDQRIRELLDLRLEWLGDLEADGNILRVDVDRRYVILDVGAANGVFPGLIFEVFQYVKGKHQRKGRVEVTSVGTHIATCRILEEADSVKTPINPRDLIANPVFNEKEPKVFFFTGEFGLYNKGDLETFVKRLGAEVRQELSPGIDFMVVGVGLEEADRLQADVEFLGAQYGVKALYEDRLVEFLNTSFDVAKND